MVGEGEFPTRSRKVPTADNTRNFFQEEVVGNKTDAAVTSPSTTKSLMAYSKGALNQLSSIITLIGQVIDVHQNVVGWSDIDRSARFEISLIDKDSGAIASGDITAGTYVINRNRHKAITAFADAGGGDVTVTSAGHGLSDGETVVITGTTNYDGSYTISNTAADTFDITATWVATETGMWSAWQEIVASTAFSKSAGLVYLDYTFVDEDWNTDDIFQVTPSGISVDVGGSTYYPAVTSWVGVIQDTSTIEGKIDTIDGVVAAIPTNPMLDTEDGSSFTAIPGIASTPTDDTHIHADNTNEQDVVEFANTNMKHIKSIFLDTNALTQEATVRVQVKIDGTNYRTVDETIVLSTAEAVLLNGFSADEHVKVTLQSSIGEGASRDVPYKVVTA